MYVPSGIEVTWSVFRILGADEGCEAGIPVISK
jgi:hypothetical protein